MNPLLLGFSIGPIMFHPRYGCLSKHEKESNLYPPTNAWPIIKQTQAYNFITPYII